MPERFTQVFHSDTVSGDERIRWQLSVGCTATDGRIGYNRVELVVLGEPLTPAEVQRLPWGKLATWAAESNAATTSAARLEAREVIERQGRAATRRDSRRRVRGAERALEAGRALRTATDDAKLRRVLELRAEAERAGVPYSPYVAERMGYSTAYVRRLAKRARDSIGG